ncbi:hypothetical protein A9978_10790 [Pseudomonas sp. UMC65]|uniref:fimbrial protein n=1 Tax=unclassified Pseudomonas TaxID=196821 RepID=UPI00160468F0|nr:MULTISPECIES: fimbrial protein [unclassified Pseudomonas]MBB1612932.1 hypothetical protein [Pseudomonas sp. UMC65]MBB1623437.1 hypothetical protein [Pseudomonas sp. UME65]
MNLAIHRKTLGARTLALALALVCGTCLAGTYNATANISGSITQPGCKFSLGNSLDVRFGDIDVTKIAAEHYSVPIELDIDCGAGPSSIVLKLTGVSGYSPDVIQTDVQGLGIKLTSQRWGTVWQANTSIRTTTTNNNHINATLTALPGTQFQTGAFSANVSISADYD